VVVESGQQGEDLVTTLVLGALGAVGGLVLSAIIKIYLGASVEYFAAATIGVVWKRGEYDVRGTWRSEYEYPSHGRNRNGRQMMRVRQIGKNVYGKNIGNSVPHRHAWHLKLDGAYLTGTWRNTSPGARHHGVMQLRIRADGTEMAGRWVGFDGDSVVQGGAWKVIRL
jgi:hypothetical protein